MKVMASNKVGNKKNIQIGVRLTDGQSDTLTTIIESIKERSNGLAEPEKSAVVLELMGFTPKRLITDEDREFVRQRVEADHPPISAEDESPVKKGKRDVA